MNTRLVIKFVLRKLRFNKAFSLLNILGLGIGLSVAVIVFLYVDYETSFDKFNKDADRIFINKNEPDDLSSVFPVPFSESLQNEIPEVETAANILPWDIEKILTSPKGEFSETCRYMDDGIFRIFSIKIIRQSQDLIFPDVNSLAISESLAAKLFGTTELAIGKTITIDKKNSGTVSTIFTDIPTNSSIRFDMAAPMQKAINDYGITVTWNDSYVRSFVKLKVPLKLVKSKFASYSKKHNFEFTLFPLTDLHLAQKGREQKTILTIAVFASIFVMLLACINFINLSTANIFKRSREVGINKLLGSSVFNIYKNFIAEILLLTFISFLAALLITSLLLPYINHLIGSSLAFAQLNIPKLMLLLAIVASTSFLTAIIPSHIFAKAKPIQIFNKQIDRNSSTIYLRKGLMILQLSLTIVILTTTLFINKQVRFIGKTNLGFDKENMIFIEPKEYNSLISKTALLNEKLLQYPIITSVCEVDCKPGIVGSSTSGFNWSGKDPGKKVSCFLFRVCDDFIKTFKVRLIEGEGFKNDQSNRDEVVINKTFAKLLSADDKSNSKIFYLGNHPYHIIGIIDDFSFNSIKEKPQPIAILYQPSRGFYPCVRYANSQKAPEILAYINKCMKELYPDISYKINFTNDFILNEFMAREIRMSKFFNLFSILGLIVCSIGLLGVALFESHNRTKEIGIRKINGAKVSEVMTMLNIDFVKWVAIAFVIATPIAWYAMHKWLENFAYKTDLSWWIFALAGLLALGIALLTMCWQSWKAATRNPVEALRYE